MEEIDEEDFALAEFICPSKVNFTEIIREGIDGFVVGPCDVEGLAGKIEWLMAHRDRASQMGENAGERAKEFSWDMHRERLQKVLEAIGHAE